MKKILFEIGHPAHVHHFKNLYWELQRKGWEALFITKDKEFAVQLLEYYNIPHAVLGRTSQGMFTKIITLPFFIIKAIKIALSFKPDIFISRVSILSGVSSIVLRKPHLVFADTESSKYMDIFSMPMCDSILTSNSYYRNLGKKQLRYPGYHELAYLHPNVFTPNESVLESLGVEKGKKYAIVRFVAWTAHHDVGMKGMAFENKLKLIKELSKHVKVFISSEAELPDELKEYQIQIKPEDMHSVLAHAKLYIGESSTMAAEAAVLGVPAVFVHDAKFGLTTDIAKNGLLFQHSTEESEQLLAIQKAIDLAKEEDTTKYKILRDKMLKEKIDVTAFMLWFVENYPKSKELVKQTDFNFDQFR